MPVGSPERLFETIAPEAAGMPLFRVVKRSLLRAIEAGTFLPGGTLPSESEIAAAMGVSIGTLRRAVDELEAERVLVRRQGRGTFVATHGADPFPTRFFNIEPERGERGAPVVDLVSFERARAESEAADALRLRPGDAVFRIENRSWLRGEAVVYDRLTLPALLFKGLTERRFRESAGAVYQLFQTDFGITVLTARERVRAAAADRDAVRVLGLPLGQPVLQLRRTALTFGDRPVEYRLSIVDTTHHDYVAPMTPAGRAP